MDETKINEFENMQSGERLLTMPKLILERELEIMRCSERQEELLIKLKVLQTTTMDDITSELTPEGKSKYTNDTTRKIEQSRRLKDHEGYQNAQVDHDKLVKQNKINAIYLDYLKKIFRAAEAMARLGSR